MTCLRSLTITQLSTPAKERDPEQRAQYMEAIAKYNADQLVFADESYYDNRDLKRLTGWSKAGTRATVSAPFQNGTRYVLVAVDQLIN